MKEIDEKLNQWIYNSIVRTEIREVIMNYIQRQVDKAYESGVEAGLDYKQNTNEDG